MANQSREAGIRLVVGGGSLFGTLRLEDVSLNIDPATRPHVVGDIVNSPFRSAVFQQVYFERVPFTAFTGQNRQALAETAHILQPGGRLVIESRTCRTIEPAHAKIERSRVYADQYPAKSHPAYHRCIWRTLKVTPRVYCRCNSGHYFLGDSCPLDGWSSPASEELNAAVARLSCSGKKVSLEGLRRAGLSEAALRRTVVIEFGDDSSAFEAVSPEGYVVGGEWKTMTDLGQSFK